MAAEWMWMVNLETTGGYRDQKTEAPDLVEEARKWVEGAKIYHPGMVQPRWRRHQTLDKLLEESSPREVDSLSPIEFFADPSRFATMGSGRGLPRFRAEVRQWSSEDRDFREEEVTMKSSKWAGYLASTPEELVNLALKPGKQVNYMFMKPDEPAKIRTIVVGDQRTYLLMAYIYYYFMSAITNCKRLPLTWSAAKRAERLKDFARASQNSNTVKVPLDQSDFDANVSLDLVIDILVWMVRVAAARAGRNSEWVMLFGSRLVEALNGGMLIVEQPGKPDVQIPIDRGVLSGWLITALLDALANYVQFEEIREAMLIPEVQIPVNEFFGDDVNCETRSEEVAVALIEGYRQYGLEVNPSKFWISRERGEFLRLVSYEGGVRGYPARTITGLLFFKPNSQPERGAAALQGRLESWTRLISRGADKASVMSLLYKEVSRILEVENEVARKIVHTPKAAGGLGMTPFTNEWWGINWEASQRGVRFLDVQSPMLYGFLHPADVVTQILKSQLISPPMRARKFELKKRDLERVNLKLTTIGEPWDHLSKDKPPQVHWKERNQLRRMDIIAEARDNPDYVNAYLTNPSLSVFTRQRLGKRWWLDWLAGPTWSSPTTVWNDQLTGLLTTNVAAQYWSLAGRLPRHKWELFVEFFVQAQIERSRLPLIGS
jgi:hypothetical protein